MRCYKCGFYSFDYLADCKKCSADLTMIRQELGLLDVEEDLPFTLDVLVEMGPSDADKAIDSGPFSPGAQAAIESPGDLEVLELSDADLELLDLADDEMDQTGDAAPEAEQASSLGEDAEARTSLGELPEIDLEEMEAKSGPPATPSLEKAAEIAGDLEADLSIDISETDLSNILEDLQAINDEEKDKPGASRKTAEPNGPASDASDLRDEILFELSEENDNLFGSGAPKTPNGGAAKTEGPEIEFSFDDNDLALESAPASSEPDKGKSAENADEPHELTFDNIERELILDLLSTLDEAAKKQDKGAESNGKHSPETKVSGKSSTASKDSGPVRSADGPENDSFVLDLSDDFSEEEDKGK